jgi:hypothetical protein
VQAHEPRIVAGALELLDYVEARVKLVADRLFIGMTQAEKGDTMALCRALERLADDARSPVAPCWVRRKRNE